MKFDAIPAGLKGHLLRLAGKGLFAVGVASERIEAGLCIKCGESPGPPPTRMCEPCARTAAHSAADAAMDLIMKRRKP